MPRNRFRFERINITRKAQCPTTSERWDAMGDYQIGRDRIRGIVKQLQEIVETAKARPCTDCNLSFPPPAMHFDHLPKFKKLFNISQYRVLTPSQEILRAEMAKCEVVCANCHAVRTQRRSEELRKRRHMH